MRLLFKNDFLDYRSDSPISAAAILDTVQGLAREEQIRKYAAQELYEEAAHLGEEVAWEVLKTLFSTEFFELVLDKGKEWGDESLLSRVIPMLGAQYLYPQASDSEASLFWEDFLKKHHNTIRDMIPAVTKKALTHEESAIRHEGLSLWPSDPESDPYDLLKTLAQDSALQDLIFKNFQTLNAEVSSEVRPLQDLQGLGLERMSRYERQKQADKKIKSFVEEAEILWDEHLERTSLIMNPSEIFNLENMNSRWKLMLDNANPKGKLIVLGVVFAALLGASFFLVREVSLHRQAKAELVKSIEIREKMELSFAQLKKEMETQAQALAKVSEDLGQEKTRAELAEKQRLAYAEQIAEMKKTYESQIGEIKNQLQVKEDLTRTLKNNLESLRVAAQGSARASASADAEPQTGAPGGRRPMGKVTLIDKRNHFIIVNLGFSDRVSIGQRIIIFSGNEQIGEGRIDRIYHDLSAVTVLSEHTLSQVQKGDRVTVAV